MERSPLADAAGQSSVGALMAPSSLGAPSAGPGAPPEAPLMLLKAGRETTTSSCRGIDTDSQVHADSRTNYGRRRAATVAVATDSPKARLLGWFIMRASDLWRNLVQREILIVRGRKSGADL